MKIRTVLVSLGLLLLCALPATAQARKGRRTLPAGPTIRVNLYPTKVVSSVTSVDFGAISTGDTDSMIVTLSNTGGKAGLVTGVDMLLGAAGNSAAWGVSLGGQYAQGGLGNTSQDLDTPLPVVGGLSIPMTIRFSPNFEQYDAFVVRVRGDFDGLAGEDTIDINVAGLGGHVGDPYLHVVLNSLGSLIDYDGDSMVTLDLDGSTSHTHQPGRTIVAYEWTYGGNVVGNAPTLSYTVPVGSNTVSLKITDDGVPARSYTDSMDLMVLPVGAVPGPLALYYQASSGSASDLLDAIPSDPDFGEVLSTLQLPNSGGLVGSSQMDSDTMVRLVVKLDLDTTGSWNFTALGGAATRLELEGQPFGGPAMLTAGTYDLEARFAIDDAGAQLPLSVMASLNGGAAYLLGADKLSHDESTLAPIINSMPSLGNDSGGNLVSIAGIGFFPDDSVTVHWGGIDYTEADFSVLTPNLIEFLSPPGAGNISVSVESPVGTSKSLNYGYSPSGPVPVNFVLSLNAPVTQPTAGVWGPDNAFYVASLDGTITRLEFDATYDNVLSSSTFPGVSLLSNKDILGITINPHDPPSPVRLYVSHGKLFVNGGTSFTGPSPYTGQVSLLEGPDFDTAIPVITQLPSSNHDHGVNGLQFDHNGDLYLAVGSQTNAGVRHPNSGDIDESPLSGAILKAELSKPGFNGAITYVETEGGMPNDDQVFGESVDVAPGVDLSVHTAGIRNAYGLLYTTKGRLYCTDNGPNVGFGATSTGPSSEGPDPFANDELNLCEYGTYHGHPNRNRGRYDARQNVYHGSGVNDVSIPNVFTQRVSFLPASSNGIDEYRSAHFQEQMRGRFIVQKYLAPLRHTGVSPDGRNDYGQTILSPTTGALGVHVLPDGVLAALNLGTNQVQILRPDDQAAVGFVVHDIFPWRAPATGGYPFVISGVGFGNLGDTTVSIGGLAASLTSVTSNRIQGLVPVNATPSLALDEVSVTVGAATQVLSAAFRYLLPEGQAKGFWDKTGIKSLPVALGEVACAEVDGILYVLGEGSSATFAYDIYARAWNSSLAVRPFPGHHHAIEVVDGLIYLIGGLGGGSEGKVQIYDPSTNLWSTGTDMTWSGGSVSTAVIGDKIYVAGGIVSTFTVGNVSVYDPLLDSWTTLAQMPDGGRNHTAAGTDGERMFIFGGRKGGNFVTNGFDTVMIFDPLTNLWESSDDAMSSLAPLPIGRGGMGKAIWYQGEFYVMGGETDTGPGATVNDVYDRVDVYDPQANTWRLEAPLSDARHGIFPVLFESRMFVVGGGLVAGFAQTVIHDTFTRQ